MEKAINTLEISSSAVKLVVGFVNDGTPYVLYANKVVLENALEDFFVAENENIINAIKTLISDAEQILNTEITEVILALPAAELGVFSAKRTTNTLASKIEQTDIKNILTLMRKSKVQPDQTIVSILPQLYITENGKESTTLPYNEVSNTLTVNAYIHVLPIWIYTTYIDIVQKAGIKVTKVYVDKHALTELIDHPSYGTASYFLVDIGAKMTSISYVSNHNLFFNRYIALGGQDLTDHLALKFGLERFEAEELKVKYGLDTKNINVNISLAEGVSSDGQLVDVNLDNLYFETKQFLTDLLKRVNDEIEIMIETQKISNAYQHPLIFIGGGARLYKLEDLIREIKSFPAKFIFKQTAFGARDLTYAVNLGLIKAYSKYIKDIGDERSSFGALTRS
ncbi:MAG TPA: pilus assembly protein PilM [Bacilli bacterium]|nr:pilus assembly protein PilM [Bacilli bacterium]